MKSVKITKKTVLIFVSVLLVTSFAVCVFSVAAALCINAYVRESTRDMIISQEEASQLAQVDCILVLGCLVHSHMLNDRLETALDVYESGASDRLLMSGDNGRKNYNEVAAMKEYAKERGAPAESVFTDHAGFSTYESLYRAKEIFCADKIIIVTQGYHLHRALYIARSLGIEAYGVSADVRTYSGQTMRDVREVLARNKDFVSCIFKPKPTYLGEKIPISGSCTYSET